MSLCVNVSNIGLAGGVGQHKQDAWGFGYQLLLGNHTPSLSCPLTLPSSFSPPFSFFPASPPISSVLSAQHYVPPSLRFLQISSHPCRSHHPVCIFFPSLHLFPHFFFFPPAQEQKHLLMGWGERGERKARTQDVVGEEEHIVTGKEPEAPSTGSGILFLLLLKIGCRMKMHEYEDGPEFFCFHHYKPFFSGIKSKKEKQMIVSVQNVKFRHKIKKMKL